MYRAFSSFLMSLPIVLLVVLGTRSASMSDTASTWVLILAAGALVAFLSDPD